MVILILKPDLFVYQGRSFASNLIKDVIICFARIAGRQ
nr:MAG TPA: hypothetical protein [Caudoviricetes sp.]